MKFYTNVQLIGNQFLVRGVENGRRYEHRDEFFPTLFVKSKKNTKYKTLSENRLRLSIQALFGIVVSSIKNMKTLITLRSMGMTDTYTNIFQRNIQRMKLSLTYLRLNLLLWILRLRLSTGSQTLNLVLKRF